MGFWGFGVLGAGVVKAVAVRAARGVAGVGRDHGIERLESGARVSADAGRHRSGSDQARWDRERRHRRCHCPRIKNSRQVSRAGRAGGRSPAVRAASVCRRALWGGSATQLTVWRWWD